jgi:5-methylcytosine-specific restriction endonuclease McrA
VAVSGYVRRYLFEQKACCWECGWAKRHPVTGRIPLHIDHVDGDWRHNQLGNLRLLCPNCHALTPSYGVLNRGRGRPYHMIKGLMGGG